MSMSYSTLANIPSVILSWLLSWYFQTAPPLFLTKRLVLQQQLCNLRKLRFNHILHFLLNFHRTLARVLPIRPLIIINPITQPCSHWLQHGFHCSDIFFSFVLFEAHQIVRPIHYHITLTFFQLHLHPFLQLFFQLCESTAVSFCSNVFFLLCFKYQLQVNPSWSCLILQSVHSALNCTQLCLFSDVCCIPEPLVQNSCLQLHQTQNSQHIVSASFRTAAKIGCYFG